MENRSALFSIMQDVSEELEPCIGAEQRARIENLEVTVKSLRDQLQERDQSNQFLKSIILAVENKVSDIIEKQKATIAQNSPEQEKLEEILDENDVVNKIDMLFNLLQEKKTAPSSPRRSFGSFAKDSPNSDVVKRLKHQLIGHVDFLTRLVDSPEYQQLFLISDSTGRTFLQESTKNQLLEQARRTTELLYDVTKDIPKDTDLANINEVLSQKIDLEHRTENLKHFIKSNALTHQEIGDLLLQETFITSLLSKTLSTYQKKLKQAEGMTQTVQSPRSTSDSFDRRAKQIMEIVNNALGEDEPYSKESLLNSVQRMASDYLEAREIIGDENPQKFAEYAQKQTKILTELSKRVKDLNERSRSSSSISNNQQQTDSNALNWQMWARRVYAGLLGLEARPKSEREMQIVIEESALTSVGGRRLQVCLESLRNQKRVMREPDYPRKDNVTMKTLVAVTISIRRMMRGRQYLGRRGFDYI